MWGPPEFIPAVITELAGIGLRIESSLETKAGERVLVIFGLEQKQDSGSRSGRAASLKIVEGVGEVRHTKATMDGLSIAVELTGLSDSNIDELTRATNAVSLGVNSGNRNMPVSANAEGVAENTGISRN